MRSRNLLAAIFVLTAFALPSIASSQGIKRDPGSVTLDLGLNYQWLHANAPVGQCGCFSANGGSGVAVVNLGGAAAHLSLLADISGSHANNLNGTSQTLTVTNYLFGARYTLPRKGRFGLYGQALTGLSHESSNYIFAQGAHSIAFSVGGGTTMRFGKRLGWNMVQADWIHSILPNGSNNLQNDLRLSSGIFVHIGGR